MVVFANMWRNELQKLLELKAAAEIPSAVKGQESEARPYWFLKGWYKRHDEFMDLSDLIQIMGFLHWEADFLRPTGRRARWSAFTAVSKDHTFTQYWTNEWMNDNFEGMFFSSLETELFKSQIQAYGSRIIPHFTDKKRFFTWGISSHGLCLWEQAVNSAF